MNTSKIVTVCSVALSMGLLLAGCRSTAGHDPEVAAADPTMLSFEVSGLRADGDPAGGDSQADAAPINGEGKVASVELLMEDRLMNPEESTPALPTDNIVDAVTTTYSIDGIETEAERSFTLLLNRPKSVPAATDATISLDLLGDLCRDNGFLMTGTGKGTVKPAVDKKDIKEGNNYFTIPVERVVSKAQLTTDENFFENITNLPISDNYRYNIGIYWTMAGSAKSVFLTPDKAGDRKMTNVGDKGWIYAGYTESAQKEGALMKLSDYEDYPEEPEEEGKDFLTTNFNRRYFGYEKTVPPASIESGIYFLGHKLDQTKGINNPYPREVTYAHIPYFKVYATIPTNDGAKDFHLKDLDFFYYSKDNALTMGANGLPTKPLYPDPSVLKAHLSRSEGYSTMIGTYRCYWVNVTGTSWLAERQDNPAYKDRIRNFGDKTYLLVEDEPGTFYLAPTGQIYATLLAALAHGKTSLKKYDGGRMVYMTPLNAQGEPGKIYNCDTRRNNIYEVTLLGIDGLGFNYDPVDPDDPFIPKPDDNPYEPPTPVPPINDLPVKLRVKTNVLPWNYFHQSYDLVGGNAVPVE